MSEIVSYQRVSTYRQAVEGESLPAQAERIRAFAAQHGHAVVGEFSDDGLSGMEMEHRPGVQAAIRLACARRCPLVVSSLSRLARSTRDALAIGERLTKAGASLHSLTEAIDTSNPTGRLVWVILAAVGQWAAEVSAEATRQTLHHLRGRGRRISGAIPYGFDCPDGESLVPNPVEQAVIARMAEMRAAGTSYAKIAEALSAEGIPTKAGNAEWMPKVVSAILQRDWVVAA